MMRYLLIFVILSSCSHHSTKRKSFVDEINEENISVKSILDLARSSYLKGCVDSKNYWLPEKKVSSFEQCKTMALEHQNDIKQIIYNNVEPEVIKKQIK
jgi:hypothetical protein